jgi:hypothetical protein
MRMYRACCGWRYGIEPIDVSRITEKTVFILLGTSRDGKKHEQANRIESEGIKFCNTWDEAHEHLMEHIGKKVENAESTLASVISKYEKVKTMVNPEVKK